MIFWKCEWQNSFSWNESVCDGSEKQWFFCMRTICCYLAIHCVFYFQGYGCNVRLIGWILFFTHSDSHILFHDNNHAFVVYLKNYMQNHKRSNKTKLIKTKNREVSCSLIRLIFFFTKSFKIFAINAQEKVNLTDDPLTKLQKNSKNWNLLLISPLHHCF